MELVVDYAVVFLDASLSARYGLAIPDQPLIGLTHGPLRRGLTDLCEHVRVPSSAREPLVEGCALQLLAHLSGIDSDGPGPSCVGAEVSLPVASLAQLDLYVRDHLAEPIGIDQLAKVAGLSRRHSAAWLAATSRSR